MTLFFQTDRNLPFQKGEIKYERAIICLDEVSKEIEVECDYVYENKHEIPIWGGDYYQEDEKEILEIAKSYKVQIVLSTSLKEFSTILKDCPEKTAKIKVSNKSNKLLYYLVAGENDCALFVAQE